MSVFSHLLIVLVMAIILLAAWAICATISKAGQEIVDAIKENKHG